MNGRKRPRQTRERARADGARSSRGRKPKNLSLAKKTCEGRRHRPAGASAHPLDPIGWDLRANGPVWRVLIVAVSDWPRERGRQRFSRPARVSKGTPEAEGRGSPLPLERRRFPRPRSCRLNARAAPGAASVACGPSRSSAPSHRKTFITSPECHIRAAACRSSHEPDSA